MQNLASIQQRTSLIKFDHLDEKSESGSISNLSTKVGGESKPEEVGTVVLWRRYPASWQVLCASGRGGAWEHVADFV